LTAVLAVALLCGGTSQACTGPECFEIWSTEAGGGALTIYFEFANKKIQTFGPLCVNGDCLYSSSDNGFITTTPPPADGYFSLADGTNVSLEIVNIDPAVSVHISGQNLVNAGDAILLGAAPALHVHPTWQIKVPEGTALGDYALSFKLITPASPPYADSQVFSVTLTDLPTPTPNQPTPTSTPSATPTATPHSACPGDCNGDGVVTIAELVSCVSAALGTGPVCAAADLNDDGKIGITEIIAAVNSVLTGCPATPTATPTLPATLDAIQSSIFSPRCALPSCHDAATHVQDLDLSAGHALAQLVGVSPTTEAANARNLRRVDPGHPSNSFLLIKLTGPPLLTPDEGLRMPETGAPLSDAEIARIGEWIAGLPTP
jgi:hypothetical protein